MAAPRITAVQTWESLFRCQVLVMRELLQDFPEELTLNEYDLLFNLSRESGDSALLKELTGQLLISQPSVSRLVDRLIERGLLVKEQNAEDRRGAIVTMTDAGREIYRRTAIQHAQSITRIVGSALDDAELAQLHALTSKLRDSL